MVDINSSQLCKLLVFSILSGILYHLGGIGKPYPTKLRDWCCPVCLVACLWLLGGKLTWIAGLSTFVLSWGALSTYYKKGTNCKWWNWFFHGLGCGLAALPLIWCGVGLYSVLYRTLFCAVAMTAVSEFSEDVRYEEFMRGFLFTSSIVFLI